MICFGGFLFPVIFSNKHGRMRILARNPERMAKPVGCLNSARTGKGTRMPKVSVIVPCYNVEKYVARCLDSLISQTLQDIEIICIDDKSTDGTLDIVKQYVARDRRVRLIAHDVNMGVAVARNDGMNIARGEYIGFVDPDDYVDLDFYECLYRTAKKAKADIARGVLNSIDFDGREYFGHLPNISQTKFNFNGEFSTAVYKRDFLNKNNIRFPINISISEDLFFLTQAIYWAKNIVMLDNVAYWYIRRPGSADSDCLSDEKLQAGIQSAQRLLDWANSLPDITRRDYSEILRIVYRMICLLAMKKTSSSNQYDLCAAYMYIVKNVKYLDELKKMSRAGVFAAARDKNMNKLHRCLLVRNTRIRLFGLIPVIKIATLPGIDTHICLFEKIPVLKIVPLIGKTKVFLFGILLFTKNG